ncbi:DedA family protein [Brachybacterium phenoliresistens]|uniref:Membrane protein n=1 Tax=Brachybacterium phenoliresistens TaxID=396014 RepID=Z9JXM8_9MICO|nr:DedA family protein [Brachybacterium phenoliresistens]EWS82778.1 membrane protein [Brachybacterium phenoliresistens]
MESLLQLLEATLASPWLYALILAAVAVDVLLPLVPAETMVIAAGAFVAAGQVDPVLLVLSAASGALIGDLAAHHVGRAAGPLARWARRSRIADGLFRWAEAGLEQRAAGIIMAGRFIPGGRTATAITSGVLHFPRRRFVLWAALAGIVWSLYSAGIGMLGGAAFRDRPLVGVAVGIGAALLLGGGAELLRARRTARSRPGADGAAAATDDVPAPRQAAQPAPDPGRGGAGSQSAPAQGICVP